MIDKCLYNCLNCFPSPCHKAVVSTATLITITTIAIAIIGLAASPGGPFNAITQLGRSSLGTLLGFSMFAFILEAFWISQLSLNKRRYLRNIQLRKEISQIPISDSPPATLGPYVPPTLVHTKPGALSPIELYEKKSQLQPIEEAGHLQPLQSLPFEITLLIFSEMSPHDLGRCQRVNKIWLQFANLPVLWNAFDLRKLSPSIRVLDLTDWKSLKNWAKLGLGEEEPEVDKRALIPFMFKLLSSLHIEEDKGITIFTIPRELTYETSVKIRRFFFPRLFVRSTPFFHETVSAFKAEKAYRIIISTKGIEETRDICFSRKNKLFQSYDFALPETAELMAFLTLSYIRFNETGNFECLDKFSYGISGNFSNDLSINSIGKKFGLGIPAQLIWKVPEVKHAV